MKLSDIYQHTLSTPIEFKNTEIRTKTKRVPDTYEPFSSNSSKINATLLKPVDNDNLRFVKVSFIENKILLPEKMRTYKYDTVVGFYRTEVIFTLKDNSNIVNGLKTIPADNLYFIFNLTKETDRVKRKFFQEMLERKGIPYILADALEGFDDEDLKSLSIRDIRLQGFHEIISLRFSSFQFDKTLTV